MGAAGAARVEACDQRLWHNPSVPEQVPPPSERPSRPPRGEPREVVELKQLRISHPELASAVDMQIALVDVQRRVQSRVPLPWIQAEPDWLRAQQAAGRPLVRFADIPLEWSDFRLTFRQTADILRRFDALEPAEHETILALARDGNSFQPLVERWYTATSGIDGSDTRNRILEGAPANLDQVLVLAVRPFLARCAEVLMQKAEVAAWNRGHCPMCGWEPDFAVIVPNGEDRKSTRLNSSHSDRSRMPSSA